MKREGSKTKGGCDKGTSDGCDTGKGNGIKDPTSAKFPSFVTKDWT